MMLNRRYHQYCICALKGRKNADEMKKSRQKGKTTIDHSGENTKECSQ